MTHLRICFENIDNLKIYVYMIGNTTSVLWFDTIIVHTCQSFAGQSRSCACGGSFYIEICVYYHVIIVSVEIIIVHHI